MYSVNKNVGRNREDTRRGRKEEKRKDAELELLYFHSAGMKYDIIK